MRQLRVLLYEPEPGLFQLLKRAEYLLKFKPCVQLERQKQLQLRLVRIKLLLVRLLCYFHLQSLRPALLRLYFQQVQLLLLLDLKLLKCGLSFALQALYSLLKIIVLYTVVHKLLAECLYLLTVVLLALLDKQRQLLIILNAQLLKQLVELVYLLAQSAEYLLCKVYRRGVD